MRRFSVRATAAALALILGTSPVASASYALGDEINDYSVSVSQNTDLTTGALWSSTYSDLRTEHYFTYRPDADVRPVVSFGDSILSKSTLGAMAQDLEDGGSRVVGGVNGDYFVVATGAPLGLVITDGVLRSSASYLYGVGFNADGTVFIGKPQFSVTANFRDHSLIVAGVNKVRTATDGYYLLTDDFSATTQNTAPGVDVILAPVLDNVGQADEDGLVSCAKPTVGGRVSYVVEQVLQSSGSIPIPKGKAVLTINNQSNAWLISELAALQPGDTLDLDVTSSDPRWAEADYAVGGMYKLVTDGTVESGLDASQAPRSAVGIKPDGTAVFYTIDGRQSGYSLGATLTQVAKRLVELGCTEAVCLDGGGSTTVGVTYPDSSDMTVINRPSDGTQRAVSNAIFLVSDLSPTGVLDHFYVSPGGAMLLPGAKLQLKASAVDTAWYPMASDASVSWSVTDGAGSVSSGGLFTAGAASGVSLVTASSGSAAGSAEVTTVAVPDSLQLLNQATGASVTALSLEPGQSIDLTAAASYRKLPLTAQDGCFAWTASAGAGTVDANGLFTAADRTGSGTLTVSVGGRSVVVPVTVTGHILPLEDFENDLGSFVSTDTADVALYTGAEKVRYGKKSLSFTYDTSETGTASAAAFLSIPSGERYLNLWIDGDGSGNTLTATAAVGSGAYADVTLTTLDFTGWKYVTVPLPADTVSLSAFQVVHTAGAPVGGTLYFDQLTTSNEAVTDLTPPVITLSVSGGRLLATVVDNIAQTFDKKQVSVTCDGTPLSFTWNAAESVASAALPADDGRMHRLTVTAVDVCGNIGTASYDIEPAVPEDVDLSDEPFTDMDSHWAEKYTTYLYEHGITNGISTDSGLQFQPGKDITRGEFFLMVARWMGLDLNDYADVQLPFDDADTIPAWALIGVKSMYALGILNGSRDGDRLNANAGAAISRAEAMAILGRIQARGYAEPALSFDDADKVPSWAVPYVSSLTGEGVVSGYDNKLYPADPVKRSEVAKMLYLLL